MDFKKFRKGVVLGVTILAICALSVSSVMAQALPGGTLDPLTIPKYVTPLVIPPVMKDVVGDNTTDDYAIAVRQFDQQILPGGIWTGGGGLPPTTVWSYGPAADTPPAIAPVPAATSQFNYPAFTIEATNGPDDMSGGQVNVDWINDLVVDPIACVDPTDLTNLACNFLPYLIPGVVDQTLHWANPPGGIAGRDMRGIDPLPYVGPNPIITHVHGAHVGPESDGYPEAWYLPGANNIPAGYATQGTLVNQYGTVTNDPLTPGVASFTYPNDQPSTTLWYHDHTLGMTRLNVYAGPAGFWLIRQDDGGEDGLGATSILPGPAPVAGEDPNFVLAHRAKVREIPIVIQDRSFNADGSLFYPKNRAFFEGLGDGSVSSTTGNIAAGLDIPFIPGDLRGPSDIAPIWNPEAFFNTMVVNGTTWPVLEVAPALYRLRLLNGCNSRFLNLALFEVLKDRGKGKKQKNKAKFGMELPFYQIGAEQSLLPAVVTITTGFKNGVPASDPQEALLMGLAERADVLVDFSGLPTGTRIRMINTAPDAPFGGFPDIPADPATTGQVMEFVVNTALLGASPTDPTAVNIIAGTAATAPNLLALSLPDAGDPANSATPFPGPRDLALIEEESVDVCVSVNPSGRITYIDLPLGSEPFDPLDPLNPCFAAGGVPFAPKAAVLGISGSAGPPGPGGTGAQVTLWSDPIATNPAVDATETWELWNHTVDGHPIHLHLVKFKVVNREVFDPVTGVLSGIPLAPAATEAGWKDTVIAYPGEVTRVNATFDIEGLYVWHCHIVEHEDNEMMVPYYVGDPANAPAPIVFAP